MKDPLRVTTLTRIWRATRRFMSRTEWAVWLLGLSRENGEPTERGLILVQIDGLSKHQMEQAGAGRDAVCGISAGKRTLSQSRFLLGIAIQHAGSAGRAVLRRADCRAGFWFPGSGYGPPGADVCQRYGDRGRGTPGVAP